MQFALKDLNIIIIISLLMVPLLGHRLSLWITHKENGPKPTTRAQCGLMSANDCKCSRDQRLNVPSEARRSDVNVKRCEHLVNFVPITTLYILFFLHSSPSKGCLENRPLYIYSYAFCEMYFFIFVMWCVQ
jgi:hypothetical protein